MITINNKILKIKAGNQEIITHNLILDAYIKHVNLSQFVDEDYIKHNDRKFIYACFIKLDTPITDISNIQSTDFDLCMTYKTYTTTGNKFGCNIVYDFDSSYSCTTADRVGILEKIDLTPYEGKKITGFGFGNIISFDYEHQTGTSEILAFADTSQFSINMVTDQILDVTREDEFKTNMEYIGNNFPYHLAPSGRTYTQQIPPYKDEEITNIYARLYSVGYGAIKGIMLNEYRLDNNEVEIKKTDNDFSFTIKTGEKRTAYPLTTSYARSSKYPLPRYANRQMWLKENIHPSSSKYPMYANTRYIIYKYEIYTNDATDNTHRIVLGYYTMNYPSEYLGLCTVKTKTERRN